MTNTCPTRMSPRTMEFTKKLKVNRIKIETDDMVLSNIEIWDLIVSYFKMYNDRYLELLQMEAQT